MNLKERIAEYSDFPKKGILFRDFSPILRDSAALSFVVEEFSKQYNPEDVDVFVGIESRGFILACALAQRYNKGMVMLRKEGKLPGKTEKTSYTIEYGKAVMEIQKTVLHEGEKVVICDDLLATGGTAKAAAVLVEKVKAKVTGFAFIIELTELNGIKEINNYKIVSLVRY
ncbi:Adenine phosphoribosyltransferase protein [Marine Group I thaumarchaeote SCGC AAA799-O18]|jgi:adenine phosphoribosyltransferase|nr:Adenine phosphoribosyltransferase protein [Marine Group I thaumarchaeote SCGC AAA799-O18]